MDAVPQEISILLFGTWDLLIKLGLLASGLQGSANSTSPGLGLSAYSTTSRFLWVPGMKLRSLGVRDKYVTD